jgi:hypothetical protein
MENRKNNILIQDVAYPIYEALKTVLSQDDHGKTWYLVKEYHKCQSLSSPDSISIQMLNGLHQTANNIFKSFHYVQCIKEYSRTSHRPPLWQEECQDSSTLSIPQCQAGNGIGPEQVVNNQSQPQHSQAGDNIGPVMVVISIAMILINGQYHVEPIFLEDGTLDNVNQDLSKMVWIEQYDGEVKPSNVGPSNVGP